MDKENRLLNRRAFLRAAAGGAGMVLLAACGGSANQANTGGTSNGSTKTTSNNTGGNGTGGGKTPEQLNFQGPPTEVATKAPSGGTTPNATQGTSGGQTAVATQGPQATVAVPKSFKESPTLTQQVNSGKLPKVADRVPKNPKVLQPVDKAGTYGGQWDTVLLPSGDGAWLTRTNEYDYLVKWKPVVKAFSADEVEPNIAESYELKNDGKEYVFKLREGLKWSDGHPFTADDIMFWYNDVLTNKDLTSVQPTWLAVGGKPMKVVKQDDYTVSFQFAVPNGLLLQMMSTPSGGDFTNYPAHYMKQWHKKYNSKVVQEAKKQKLDNWQALFAQMADDTANPDKPVLTAWKYTTGYGQKSTTQFIAERNPYYWKVDTEGNQLPYLDSIRYQIVEKPDVMVLMGLNGELDMQDRHIADLTNKPVFYKNQKKGNYHFYDTITGSMNTVAISFNLTTRDKNLSKVFNDKNFRIGMSYAMNRQDIIDTVFVSQGEPWQLAPRPESAFYNKTLAKQYTEYDVNKANQYLDKVLPKKNGSGKRLGPNGKPFSFNIEIASDARTEDVDTMNIVKQHWAKVGIDVSIKAENRDIFYTRKEANQPDCLIWGGDGGMDVILECRWYFPFSSESNYAIPWAYWFGNPKDKQAIKPPAAARKQMKLYEQIRTTADADEQSKLMNQILDIAQQEFYALGISLPINGYGIVKNDFHNVPDKMLGSWLYPNPGPTNPSQYWKENKSEKK